MKKIIKSLIPKNLLFLLRKIRFSVKSLLFLPHYVYWGDARISTRGWQTACVEFYKRSCGLKVYEPETTACWNELLKKSQCVWDVGAHVGYFSILAVQKEKKVYAFEIDDDMIREMKKHKRKTGLNFSIIEDPLGIQGKLVEFEQYSGRSKKGAIAADNFIIETGDIPDLIKIDIDGGEFDFLEGAEKLLTEHNPAIIMELSPSRREKLIEIMQGYGYKLVKKLDWYKKGGEAHNALFLKEHD